MNDVHLPRFGFVSASRRDGDGTDGPYTRQPPAVRCTAGDSKDVSPSNSWNDSKNGSGASMAATGRTGTRCRTRRAKTQIPHRLQIRCGIGLAGITLKRLCPPRFGAMNHTTIGCGKRIRQSATCGATDFKIAVKSRILAEFVTDASLGIEHEDRRLD